MLVCGIIVGLVSLILAMLLGASINDTGLVAEDTGPICMLIALFALSIVCLCLSNNNYKDNAEYIKAGIEQSIESKLTDDNINAARTYNKWAKENNKPEIQYLENK